MTDANTRNKYVNNGGSAGSVAVDADGLIEGNYDQVVPSFDEMNLKENLLRGIYAFGFEKTVSYPATCYCTMLYTARRHCSSTIRYRENRYVFDFDSSTNR
ncbi:hypothetical protein KIN20_004787 [Parelaphostrongylus tenuis]|uniref:Uncharacterized protein n=1 Tax=Parelaphostrongylus tenuis TaxID=148309 RepID=A0AAD5M174_PARTN|nr:hypothetical protein KIN20_004787 [Parelaphostrongylus tenuis]